MSNDPVIVSPEENTLVDLGYNYAGFGIRLGAYAIDSFVLFIPIFIFKTLTHQTQPGMTPTLNDIALFCGLLYFVLMESSKWQGTLGKQVLGLVVTDINGRRITPARALGRYLSKIISGILLGLGYLMVLVDKKRRALHDHIAKTYVLRKVPTSQKVILPTNTPTL